MAIVLTKRQFSGIIYTNKSSVGREQNKIDKLEDMYERAIQR